MDIKNSDLGILFFSTSHILYSFFVSKNKLISLHYRQIGLNEKPRLLAFAYFGYIVFPRLKIFYFSLANFLIISQDQKTGAVFNDTRPYHTPHNLLFFFWRSKNNENFQCRRLFFFIFFEIL